MRTTVSALCGTLSAPHTKSMNNEDFRRRLKHREEQLLDEMERNQSEARDGSDRDATEVLERSVNLEGAEALLRHNDADFKELEEVRDALERLEDGSFGKCIDCGKTIPQGRLEAIPWAKYCIEDQQRHDNALGDTHSLTM